LCPSIVIASTSGVVRSAVPRLTARPSHGDEDPLHAHDKILETSPGAFLEAASSTATLSSRESNQLKIGQPHNRVAVRNSSVSHRRHDPGKGWGSLRLDDGPTPEKTAAASQGRRENTKKKKAKQFVMRATTSLLPVVFPLG